LVSILETCVSVTLGSTVVQAARNIDTVRPPVVSVKGTVAAIVATATEIGPAILCVVVGLGGTDRGSRSGAVLSSNVSPLNWVTTWECVHSAVNLLINFWSKHTGVTFVIGEEIKDRAVSDQTTVVKTGVSSLLKSRDIPSVDKVTVVSVTSWVTHGEDEWLPSVLWHPPLKVGGVPDGLEENRYQVDRMGGRAWAVVVRVHCWVSHVGLV